jgi:hypothetical protein
VGKLNRGQLLDVVRDAWTDLINAEADVRRWETRERSDPPPSAKDVDLYIEQMTPVWALRARKLAETKEAFAKARRQWDALKREAVSGKDHQLSLAWCEWVFEADRLSEGFSDLQANVPTAYDPRNDPRLRAAMLRGGYSVPE